MGPEFEVRRLSYAELRGASERFLTEHHPFGTTPVPIEEIVEFRFGIDIVPIPQPAQERRNLRLHFQRSHDDLRRREHIFELREPISLQPGSRAISPNTSRRPVQAVEIRQRYRVEIRNPWHIGNATRMVRVAGLRAGGLDPGGLLPKI